MKKENPDGKNKQKNSFTPTEVGTMLEDLHKGIKIIGENHGDLAKKLGDLEVTVHGNSESLAKLEFKVETIRIKVFHTDDRVSLLDKKVGQLDTKVDRLDTKVGQLDKKADHLSEEIAAVKIELKKDIRDLGERLSAVEARR